MSVLSVGIAIAAGPVATAEPDPDTSAEQPVAAGPPVVTAPVADPDAASPAADACKQFAAALDYAATNYEDFAYATAGGGNTVNYADPSVEDSNVVGRTALRAAAATALNASMAPGVPPEVANPMKSWSLHATKLLFVMGLRGGGDSLNNSAQSMNDDANATQMACAMAGAPAVSG
jgi:peptidoglycan hydrolase-like protein with peptidoglycan-binding domain